MPTIMHVVFYTGLYGAEQSLLILIKGLSAQGYRSVVAVYQPGPLTEKLEALNITVIYMPYFKPWLPGNHVPRLKQSLYNFYHLPILLYSALALKKIIRQYQVDLVHTSTAMIFDGALAAYLAGVPHVWHIRETIETGKTYRFFWGSHLARRLIAMFSQRIIAISEAIGQAYRQDTSANCDKVKIIYNGVELALYDQTVPHLNFRSNLDIPLGAKLVGLVAQVGPRKRQEDFLKAAAIVRQCRPDVIFLLAGGDVAHPSDYMQRMQILAQELDLTEHVIWLGFYENSTELFTQLDLLVLPSKDEPFGRVIIEAMAASKPVVATEVGGIPEIVVEGVTGFLVPPQAPTALAEAMLKVLKDPQRALDMGQAGRRRVEQYFTTAHYVDQVETLYQELLQT